MAIVADDIQIAAASEDAESWEFVPEELRRLENPQAAIPQLAKDAEQMRAIEASVQRVPTRHVRRHGDARKMTGLGPESVHFFLASPPYWTLTTYRHTDGQLGQAGSLPNQRVDESVSCSKAPRRSRLRLGYPANHTSNSHWSVDVV